MGLGGGWGVSVAFDTPLFPPERASECKLPQGPGILHNSSKLCMAFGVVALTRACRFC